MTQPDLGAFERYRPLMPSAEWPDFVAALHRPLPTCIWTNPTRTTPSALSASLHADGLRPEPLAWLPTAFRLPDAVKPGNTWQFLSGQYHIQEEVSLLPVTLLELESLSASDRVLDLCAAPGNKTAQIAARLNNQGTVIANDRDFNRLKPARFILDRLGLLNVTTTVQDAVTYPTGQFARVLVDAPCSCEGTVRKSPHLLETSTVANCERLGRVQVPILRRAVELCRPGGLIVYATCTFAPEENELVVAAILRHFGGAVRLRSVQVPGLVSSPGLTGWQGETFPPELADCLRIWPHQNDSGGFFVAVLEKLAPTPNDAPLAPLAEPGRPVDRHTALASVSEHFGLPESVFEAYRFYQRNAKTIHLTAAEHRPPSQPPADTVGLSFLKTTLRYPKLSTAAALLFGSQAQRNRIELTRPQTEQYLRRQTIRLEASQCHTVSEFGYVLLFHQGYALGVGLFKPQAEGGTVESMFPKAWSPG